MRIRKTRERVRQLEQRLAELDAVLDEVAAAKIVDELRSADRAASFRVNGLEDSLTELRQQVGGALGWPSPNP
jgi:hypothetical protein